MFSAAAALPEYLSSPPHPYRCDHVAKSDFSVWHWGTPCAAPPARKPIPLWGAKLVGIIGGWLWG